MRRLFAVSMVIAFLLSACGSGNKVGEGIPLKDIEGEGGVRLGETKSPTPKADAAPTDTTKPTSAPTNKPSETPSTQVIQVFLLTDAPYYQVEGTSPGNQMTIPSGVILRWVNRESEKDRQPFSRDLFDCPRLRPGDTCDFRVIVNGKADIEDRAKPFATGKLEMT